MNMKIRVSMDEVMRKKKINEGPILPTPIYLNEIYFMNKLKFYLIFNVNEGAKCIRLIF